MHESIPKVLALLITTGHLKKAYWLKDYNQLTGAIEKSLYA